MLVPRSFRYASSPERDKGVLDEKSGWRVRERRVSAKNTSPVRTMSEPAMTAPPPPPPTQPVAVPSSQPNKHHKASASTLSPPPTRMAGRRTRMPSAHDPHSLPPSVAALLAVTQIPRPKPHQLRRKKPANRELSIDELVNEWKNDVAFSPSYGSSSALSMLLEEQDETEFQSKSLPEGQARDYLQSRSTFADSVPSLDDNDDKSTLSLPSPPTPGCSFRHRRSLSNLKREKSRSLPITEDCATDHPLVPSLASDDPDDSLILSPPTTPPPTTKSKGRFTSNLTLSLHALKNAALTKFTALSLSSSNPAPSAPSQRTPSSPLSDDVLWSHPFLFPRFSPEVRPPASTGTPSKAERRYLNPLPLTFEEQEAPFQQALHAPFLAEEIAEAPTIQMQTYHRGRRKSSSKKQGGSGSIGGGGGAVDPKSEAGRALTTGVKMREPRENADFLRVVVLEMNMRRVGKLESGRAKMWLPPRRVEVAGRRAEGVPVRWRGVSAY